LVSVRAAFFRRFATAVGLGAGIGALLLGVGGRLVMHLFALATAGTGSFTLQGSLSVVFTGAIAGAIGGALLALIDRFLPRRPAMRAAVFVIICYIIATPGFRPPRALVFALFAPLFVVYGALLVMAWERARRSIAPFADS